MASSPRSRTKKSAPKGATNNHRNDSQTKRFLSRKFPILEPFSVQFEVTVTDGKPSGSAIWSPRMPRPDEIEELTWSGEYVIALGEAMADLEDAGMPPMAAIVMLGGGL